MSDQQSFAPSAPAETAVSDEPAFRPALMLSHVLTGMGADYDPAVRLDDIHVVRHTFRPGDADALRGPEDLSEDGEIDAERTESNRYFDLRPSRFLESLKDRLVVEWDNPRSWHRSASYASAARMPVLEIADRDKVHFPGFDGVLLGYHQLCDMVDDPRYADWRTALAEVQGIYLITDSTNGKQYVGKADGAERILGRWTTYARDGHGGNVALRELVQDSATGAATKTDYARNFVFSLLRVFGPSTPSSEVNSAESHYKAALMTREFGLNRN